MVFYLVIFFVFLLNLMKEKLKLVLIFLLHLLIFFHIFVLDLLNNHHIDLKLIVFPYMFLILHLLLLIEFIHLILVVFVYILLFLFHILIFDFLTLFKFFQLNFLDYIDDYETLLIVFIFLK